MPSSSRPLRGVVAAAALSAGLLAGCDFVADTVAADGGAPPPPPVGIIVVEPAPATLSSELPGRLEPTRIAEVRARVPGIVQQRVFQEGSEVKAGQVLFRIDPAPLQADLAAAEANLQRGQAAFELARSEVRRFAPLVKADAISRQQYDQAVAQQKLAQAEVAALRAVRDRAKLNLGYATVSAPIAGRVGKALVTEGALVGQGEPTPMATIQQIDPIYVDFTQPTTEITRLRKIFASGEVKQVSGESARVALILDDGSDYPLAGKLLFSELTVDRSTGQVTLRAEFDNPERVLLPGMYVRVRLDQGVDEQAIRIPQQAIQRATDGGATVWVIGDGDVPQNRPIVTGATLGNTVIVREGLQRGERVVVEGFQKIRPGVPVAPEPWAGA
ncbi:MAG: efflux RND transporter periplasmic adaptor subunit [Burkholderiaceae bacterium]